MCSTQAGILGWETGQDTEGATEIILELGYAQTNSTRAGPDENPCPQGKPWQRKQMTIGNRDSENR